MYFYPKTHEHLKISLLKEPSTFCALKSTISHMFYHHAKCLAIEKSWTIELKKDAKRIIKWGHTMSIDCTYFVFLALHVKFLYSIKKTCKNSTKPQLQILCITVIQLTTKRDKKCFSRPKSTQDKVTAGQLSSQHSGWTTAPRLQHSCNV